jgi:RND superfamily putative drug exporter
MFEQLGRLTTTHPWKICLAWLATGVLLTAAAPDWDTRTQDDDIRFLPDRCASVRGYRLLEKAFPREIFASRLIVAFERGGGALTPSDYRLVDQCVAELARLRERQPELGIGSVTSYRDAWIGGRLTSTDRRCTLIQAALASPFLALQTRAAVDHVDAALRPGVERLDDSDLRLYLTGPAGLGRDLTRAGGDGLHGTTIATVVLVLVILLAVYRAPLLAAVPLLTIAASVWVALKVLALATLLPGVHLVNISKVFAIVILYGAGTDYCLFLVSRYREELTERKGTGEAIRRSVTSVGGALAASAGTVVCGLGLMGLAEFAKVRCAGPAIAVGLAVALVASLTLAPAALCLLGRAVFWPGRGPLAGVCRLPRREAFWERVSRGVLARPVLVWGVAVLALAPLAVLGLRTAPNYKSTGELPPWANSVRGVAAVQQHFTAGEVGPLTVLVEGSEDWDTPDGRVAVARLCRVFSLFPNVAEVRSLTQPLGSAAPLQAPAVPPAGGLTGLLRPLQAALDLPARAARDFYRAPVDGETGRSYVTRLDVVFRSDPFDAESTRATELIQAWLRDELAGMVRPLTHVSAECYGVTAHALDLAQVTEADRTRINALVVAGVLAILLTLVRRVWLAAYLLVTVLFSYWATLGATVLVGSIAAGRPIDQVEWRVPFFLFTILVAVGEDYNILLITRILQEQRRWGIREGVRRAVARTGGTITSCGLIMAGTFATLMLSGLGTLVQIGFALAFGVLLDTLIVRPVLVPAFTLWWWRETPPRSAAANGPRPALRRAG